jgi:hypothetical protein
MGDGGASLTVAFLTTDVELAGDVVGSRRGR